MGDGRLIESPNSEEPEAGGHIGSSAFSTIGELFDHECGFYLHAGMPLELYWDGDCTAVRWYREKHRRDLEQRNSELWMMGAYVYQAVLRVSPMLKSFVKNPKAEPYLEKPFPLTAEQAKVDKKARQQQQQETALAAFKAKVLKLNEQRGGDGDAVGRS